VNEIYIGIDLGGTNVKFGCFDGQMKLLGKSSAATNVDEGPEIIIERICDAIEELAATAGVNVEEISAIGMGTPGPANYREGIIMESCNMPKFNNVHVKKMISEHFGGKPFVLENDANVACFGEYTVGAGKNSHDMVFFTLGTGIGGGIVCNGHLIHGSEENAAELGHIIIYPDGRECGCGQRGCAEAYGSASATARRATEAIEAGAESSLKKVLDENGEITSKDVYEHLAAGDKLAKEITDGTAKALALLCVNVHHVTEPRKIVFAGGMIAAGDVLLDGIRENFCEQLWKVKDESVEICFATLGEDAGIIGAAALAKETFGD